MSPTISVVMPVHNGMPFLPLAVRSILCQSWHDFELIVIDDGSVDDTPQVLQQFAAADPRIRVIDCDRGGITRALNLGLSAARGELVARMDADDISYPERFETQLCFLRTHREIVAVGSWALRIDEGNDPIAVARWSCRAEQIEDELLRGKGGLCHPAAMIRRQVLSDIGGYREKFSFAQDKDLWLRLAERGPLAAVDRPLIAYREHLRSISGSCAVRQSAAALEALRDSCRRRNLPPPRMPRRRRRSQAVDVVRLRRHWIRIALAAGNYRTARKHLRHLILQDPAGVGTWLTAARFLTCPFATTNADAVPAVGPLMTPAVPKAA